MQKLFRIFIKIITKKIRIGFNSEPNPHYNVSLGFLALQATKGRAAAWLCQECLIFNV